MSKMGVKTGLRTWIRNLIPVPMAAPETSELRKARVRIMMALSMLVVICLCWGWAGGVAGGVLVALVVGLLVFLLLQVPAWMMAKNRADDAWLMRGSDEDA